MNEHASSRPNVSDPSHGRPIDDSPTRAALSTLDQLQTLASALEIQSELDACTTLSSAGSRLAQRLVSGLDAARIVVAWREDGVASVHRIADTDPVSRIDEAIEGRMIDAACEEVIARGGMTRWPSTAAEERYATRTLVQLATQIYASTITAVCLDDADGTTRGVLLVVDAKSPTTESLLRVTMPLVALKFAAIQRQTPSAIQRKTLAVVQTLENPGRGKRWLAVIGGLMLLAIPMPYRVAVDLELQPTMRRFVAVGFDGTLQSSNIRPGDSVTQGQLIATIDPREIEYELSGIEAELHQAQQERRSRMAEHDFAASKIAELETERLQTQKDLLNYRRDHLDIRSPVDGIVVSGDWKQSEGMPMTRGETLFEIAPLGSMRVEFAVPESDYAMVRVGMPVEFHLHAFANQTFAATIDKMHPRAELRDDQNVFIAEAILTDDRAVLRPGMRGRGKIVSDRNAIGWNIFHKAYHAARHAIGW